MDQKNFIYKTVIIPVAALELMWPSFDFAEDLQERTQARVILTLNVEIRAMP